MVFGDLLLIFAGYFSRYQQFSEKFSLDMVCILKNSDKRFHQLNLKQRCDALLNFSCLCCHNKFFVEICNLLKILSIYLWGALDPVEIWQANIRVSVSQSRFLEV